MFEFWPLLNVVNEEMQFYITSDLPILVMQVPHQLFHLHQHYGA